jgi:mannan endo-1,4-beta-mannosidase
MLAGWFASYTPEIVLLHFGTNDIMGQKPLQGIIDGYSRTLEGLRIANPNVVLLIAQIIPVAPSGCAACPTQTVELNAMIETWAEENATAESPVIAVDQWTGFDSTADTEDGVHPYKDSGTQKIANNWHHSLLRFFP